MRIFGFSIFSSLVLSITLLCLLISSLIFYKSVHFNVVILLALNPLAPRSTLILSNFMLFLVLCNFYITCYTHPNCVFSSDCHQHGYVRIIVGLVSIYEYLKTRFFLLINTIGRKGCAVLYWTRESNTANHCTKKEHIYS